MVGSVEGRMRLTRSDAVVDEAVAEFEAQSEVGDEVEDDAVVDEDNEEVLEDADEQSDAEEAESDDEEPAQDDEVAKADDFEWDGNPDTVPDELKPYFKKTYDTMRKGVDVWMSKKASEWDAKRKQYEARLTELETSRLVEQQKASAPKPPVRPGENATEAEVEKYWDDKAKYAAYEQYRGLIESGAIPDPVSARQSALHAQQQEMATRIERAVTAQPGYTDVLGEKMIEVAQSHPFWASQVLDENGAVELFNYVKTQTEAAALKEAAAKASTAELQRKVSAAKRKVSKPQAATKKVSPAHTFSGSLEDVVDQAFAEALSELS